MVLGRMCINPHTERWNNVTHKAYLVHTGKHVIVIAIISTALIWYMKETGIPYIAVWLHLMITLKSRKPFISKNSMISSAAYTL